MSKCTIMAVVTALSSVAPNSDFCEAKSKFFIPIIHKMCITNLFNLRSEAIPYEFDTTGGRANVEMGI